MKTVIRDHSAGCTCIPCGVRDGRIVSVRKAAEMLGCSQRRVIEFVRASDLQLTVNSTPEKPYVFASCVRELIFLRKRKPPRTPADQLLRWRLADRALTKYGITPEDWARMFERQAGKCPGCGERLGFWRSTHVDHCHQTDRVRGLLCHDCNSTISRAHDKPDVLRHLAMYLENS